MQNLSCENEFYLHDNKKSFTQERFCTWPRFKTEASGISEMAYYTTNRAISRCNKNFVLTINILLVGFLHFVIDTINTVSVTVGFAV